MYYNVNSAAESAVGGLIAGALVFIIVIVLIALAIAIIKIIGTWKMLEKGGKPGWGALIPFYNEYLLCDMVGVSPWWILIVIVSALLSFIPVIGSLLSLAASVYFSILLNVSIARSFGKEDSYAVGLILLQPIFYMILGCGSSKFIGKNPMNDAVLNSINKNSDSNTSAASGRNSSSKRFCTSCGSEIDANTKFCPSCGNEVK